MAWPTENGAPAGNAAPEKWRPYKLWIGDEWGCPDCGATIIVGVGMRPVSEHYMPEFQTEVARHGAELLVKDC